MDLVGESHGDRPLQAAVAGVDPRLDVEVTGTDTDWTARVIETDTAAKEFREVPLSGSAAARRLCSRHGSRFR